MLSANLNHPCLNLKTIFILNLNARIRINANSVTFRTYLLRLYIVNLGKLKYFT